MMPWQSCILMACGYLCIGPACTRTKDPLAVKIISSLPRTGSANQQTTPMVHGIRMALQEASFRAGPLSVSYEDLDDASSKKGDWDPEVEAANAGRAADDADVMVYIGPYNSGAAKISMPVLNRAGLAMLSVATYPGLTKAGLGETGEPEVYRPSGQVNFFRITPADDVQGALAAQWMREMGGSSVFVLDDQGLYGRGLAEVFADRAEALQMRVLGHESIDPKAQEYRSLMARIRGLAPDWVYFGGTTQTNAGQVIKDLVSSGLGAKVMLPDACLDEALIGAAGADNANERVFATFGGLPAEQLQGSGAAFVAHYQQLYHGTPEAYAVYGYVAARAALGAIEAAGHRDRAAVRQALQTHPQAHSALGDFSFLATGDTSLQRVSGSVVRQGHFVFVRALESHQED